MQSLLRHLTLGTARQDLPAELPAWLAEKDAVDPTADPAEQLLAAYTLRERSHRLASRNAAPISLPAAPPEIHQAAPPRLARALQLILEDGDYAELLAEAMKILEDRRLLVPAHLLPSLLDRAAGLPPDEFPCAQALVYAGGHRADWLTTFRTEWQFLGSSYDLAAAWQRAVTPSDRSQILRRWRQQDPAAARIALTEIWKKLSPANQESLVATLQVGLSAEDQPWLRERLGPKRKGVRRALFRLLLLAGESQAREDLTTLAAAAFDEQGKIGNLLQDASAQDLLKTYGGLPSGQTPATYLPAISPPTLLPDLLGQALPDYWVTLDKKPLKAAATALLAYAQSEPLTEFLRFATVVNPAQLPLQEAARISAVLPQESFLAIFHELLDKEKNVLHFGGVPRILVLSRHEPWSERITKAFVLQLVATLREIRDLPYTLQKDLTSHWQLAIPLLHVSTFSWLRTHLHSLTERQDAFGKLATRTLQTTHLRQELERR